MTSSTTLPASASVRTPRALLLAGLVAAVALIVYLPALLHGGLVYDDVELVQLNPRIRESFSLEETFTKPFWDVVDTEAEGRQPFYRPGVSVLFHVGWRLSGDEPWGDHLLSILLHVAACLGVFELARRFGAGSLVAATAAGLLFAVQPVHHEAVAWVAGIVDPSAVAPMLWAAVLLLRAREGGGRALYAGAAALHLAALLCKEIAFLFVPLALLGAYVLPRAQPPRAIATWAVLLVPPLLVYAIRVAIFGSAFAGFGATVVDLREGLSTARSVLLPLEFLGHFVLLAIWPGAWAPMHVFRPGAPLGDPTLLLHLALGAMFLATTSVLLFSRELGLRRSVHSFALLGFLIGVSPALLSPQSLGQFPVSERYLYLPLALACTSLGVLVAQGLARTSLARVAAAALLVCVVPLGVLAWQRASIYRDEATFFSTAIEREPYAAVAHIGMGKVHTERAQEIQERDPEGALRELGRANERFQSVSSIYTDADVYFVGFVERVRGGIGQFTAYLLAAQLDASDYREEKLREAEQVRDLVRDQLSRFRKSLVEAAPEKAQIVDEALEFPEFLVTQGVLADLRQRREEARAFFEKALLRDRDHLGAHLGLARITADSALNVQDPHALIRTWTSVIDHANAALRIDPRSARALLLLGRAHGGRGIARFATGVQTPEAKAEYQRDFEDSERALATGLRYHPREAEFYRELVSLYDAAGNGDAVVKLLFEAIELSDWRLDYVDELLRLLLLKLNRREDVLKVVLALQEREPDSIPAQELLVRYLLHLGQVERAEREILRLRELDPEGWASYAYEASLAERFTPDLNRAYTAYESALAKAAAYRAPSEEGPKRLLRKQAATFFLKLARATFATGANPERDMTPEERGVKFDRAAKHYADAVLLLQALEERVEWLEYGQMLLKAELWCEALAAFDAGLAVESEAEARAHLEEGRRWAAERCKQ